MSETFQDPIGPRPYLEEAPSDVAVLLKPRHEITDFSDIEQVAKALVGVPMIDKEDMAAGTSSYGKDPQIIEDASIPISRVVGVQSFDTWAGRGLTESGKAILNGSRSSLGVVAESAELGQMNEYLGRSGAPWLELFKDTDGEVWAMLTADGSHRTAGAKARGDTTLDHVTLATAGELPQVNFSVRERLAAKKKATDTLRGRFAVRGYIRSLVDVSQRVDDEAKQAPNPLEVDENGDTWM